AMYLLLIVALPVAYLLLCAYIKTTRRYCKSNVDLTGKTVIVTGGNAGLGFSAARQLASRNARVILACRNPEKAKDAVLKIIGATGNRHVVFRKLDTSSLKSVREFAAQILKEESRLDILINNAGILSNEPILTEDGLQLTYATNHFGSFLLTNLLLKLLKSSKPSRIVNVSSDGHLVGNIYFENMTKPMGIEKRTSYFGSKLANVLFTHELAKRLQGEGVTAYSLHPGLVSSSLIDHWHPILRWFIFNANPWSKTIDEGAQNIVYCAIEEGLEKHSGKYFRNLQVVPTSKKGYNDDVARRLWEVSDTLTQLQ
ncbi:retinol dehydrogenase 11-like, partial [Argonauta hians]